MLWGEMHSFIHQVANNSLTPGITGWQIQICPPVSCLVTPNPSDLRGRDVWGCSDKLPFHITGLSHKYLCRIWQGYYFLVVKRTAICDNICSSFLDTALHEFLLWILLREYMSLEFTENEPQDKVLFRLRVLQNFVGSPGLGKWKAAVRNK